MEVVVEVAAERRCPGKAPAHTPFVSLQLGEWSPRHRAQRDVVIREVDDGAVEAVRDRRAGRTSRRVIGPEHEVIDEELRPSSEEIGEGCCALVGFEAVLLVDSDPWQLLPQPRQLVAPPRQRLLGLEQLQAGRKPLFACSGLVVGQSLSFLSYSSFSLQRISSGGRALRPTASRRALDSSARRSLVSARIPRCALCRAEHPRRAQLWRARSDAW